MSELVSPATSISISARPWRGFSATVCSRTACSSGNSIILTIVDRFSKMAYFVPLQKLPSAKETAQFLVQHVFHLHALPMDVVSDRWPSFPLPFGQSSASCWELPPACLLVSTNSPMVRQKGRPRGCPPVHGFSGPRFLVLPSGLGGVCPQLPNQLCLPVSMALIY